MTRRIAAAGRPRLTPLVSRSAASVPEVGLAEGLAGATAVTGIAGGLPVGGLGSLSYAGGGVVASDGGGVGGGVGALGGGGRGSGGGGFPLGGDIFVKGVESRGGGAVEVEPPVADEVVLVEDGSVGAEEGVFGEASVAIVAANVKHLALGLGIGIITLKKIYYELHRASESE